MVLYFGGILLIIPKCLRYKKRVIGIIMEKRSRDSCRKMVKELKMLPFLLQYMLSLL
jgi:hypothetical protein